MKHATGGITPPAAAWKQETPVRMGGRHPPPLRKGTYFFFFFLVAFFFAMSCHLLSSGSGDLRVAHNGARRSPYLRLPAFFTDFFLAAFLAAFFFAIACSPPFMNLPLKLPAPQGAQ